MYELNKFFYAKIFDVNGSTLLIAILGLNWCICALKRPFRKRTYLIFYMLTVIYFRYQFNV